MEGEGNPRQFRPGPPLLRADSAGSPEREALGLFVHAPPGSAMAASKLTFLRASKWPHGVQGLGTRPRGILLPETLGRQTSWLTTLYSVGLASRGLGDSASRVGLSHAPAGKGMRVLTRPQRNLSCSSGHCLPGQCGPFREALLWGGWLGRAQAFLPGSWSPAAHPPLPGGRRGREEGRGVRAFR